MFNEQSHQNERSGWKFAYKGEDLLPFARRRLAEHQAVEAKLREKLACRIKDPTSFHDDTKLQQLKQDVDRHAVLREQFEVYCHEFARTPRKEFTLRLSDVVFFGIQSGGFVSSEIEPRGTERASV
jgi:hypothetical protein